MDALATAVSLGLTWGFVRRLHLWVLLAGRHARRVWVHLFLADGAAALAFSPQVVQFVGRASDYVVGQAAWQVRPSPLTPRVTLEYLLFGHAVPMGWWGLRVSVLLALMGFAVLEWGRRRKQAWRRRAWLMLLIALLPLPAVMAISWALRPIYLERSFAMLTPFLVLFLAQGIVAVPSRLSPTLWLGAALGALLAVGTVMAPALLDLGQRSGMPPLTYEVLGGRLVTSREVQSAEGRLWLIVTDCSRQPWEAFLEEMQVERALGDTRRWTYLTLYRYD